MKANAAFLMLLALGGCASRQPQGQTVADNKPDVICVREYPTGSNLPVTRCTTAAQRAAAKREADDTLESVRRVGGTAGRTTP